MYSQVDEHEKNRKKCSTFYSIAQ